MDRVGCARSNRSDCRYHSGQQRIGFEASALLSDRGACVVLAVRDLVKGRAAAARIAERSPHADVEVWQLDPTSLESIRTAAGELKAAHPRIDLSINNAGVLGTPKSTTRDGFELQFGTNHLGHFAFTGLLIDSMLAVVGSRVVTISSLGHRARAAIDFDDLHGERHYDRFAAYGRSKLANLLFTYELQRRLSARDAGTIAIGAHPGSSRTGLMRSSQAGFESASRVSVRWWPKSQRWARCRCCGRPPTRTSAGESISDPAASASNAVARGLCGPRRSRTTKSYSVGCGMFRRN